MSSTKWTLQIEVEGAIRSWTVWPSVDEARDAAGFESGGRPQARKTDNESGFCFFKVKQIQTGTLSLDDIDDAIKELSFTWAAELEKAGLGHLKPSAEGVASIKASLGKDGKLVWDLPDGTPAVAQAAQQRKPEFQPPKRPTANGKAKARATSAKGKKKTPENKDIWGKTYRVPGQKIGAGSYHFMGDKTAWLNYEKMPPHWKLSDGSPYPPRIDFENINWDQEQRNFKGTIHWLVSSKARWEYDIFFDASFIGISGTCKMYRVDAKPDADPYCVIRFGKDAKYVIESATEAQIEWYYENYDMSKETQRIINIMGEVVERDKAARDASGRGKPNAVESMGLIFGQSMQTFARDKKADAMMGESFPMRTGAKLGAPTRWDRTARG